MYLLYHLAQTPTHFSYTTLFRSEVRSVQTPLAESISNDVFGAPQDLLRIVLHPSRFRVDLFVLLLGHRYRAPGLVEHHEARAGGSLIDCSDVVFHPGPPLFAASQHTTHR